MLSRQSACVIGRNACNDASHRSSFLTGRSSKSITTDRRHVPERQNAKYSTGFYQVNGPFPQPPAGHTHSPLATVAHRFALSSIASKTNCHTAPKVCTRRNSDKMRVLVTRVTLILVRAFTRQMALRHSSRRFSSNGTFLDRLRQSSVSSRNASCDRSKRQSFSTYRGL